MPNCLREAGVGGSNPLTPTSHRRCNSPCSARLRGIVDCRLCPTSGISFQDGNRGSTAWCRQSLLHWVVLRPTKDYETGDRPSSIRRTGLANGREDRRAKSTLSPTEQTKRLGGVNSSLLHTGRTLFELTHHGIHGFLHAQGIRALARGPLLQTFDVLRDNSLRRDQGP